jgi:hypothetical protein
MKTNDEPSPRSEHFIPAFSCPRSSWPFFLLCVASYPSSRLLPRPSSSSPPTALCLSLPALSHILELFSTFPSCMLKRTLPPLFPVLSIAPRRVQTVCLLFFSCFWIVCCPPGVPPATVPSRTQSRCASCIAVICLALPLPVALTACDQAFTSNTRKLCSASPRGHEPTSCAGARTRKRAAHMHAQKSCDSSCGGKPSARCCCAPSASLVLSGGDKLPCAGYCPHT